MIGKLMCKLFGHKRMKRFPQDDNEKRMGIALFKCPRCRHEETRKVYAKPPKIKAVA